MSWSGLKHCLEVRVMAEHDETVEKVKGMILSAYLEMDATDLAKRMNAGMSAHEAVSMMLDGIIPEVISAYRHAALGDGRPSLSPQLIDKLGKLATRLTGMGEYEACDLIDTVVARLGQAQGDGWRDVASARAAALEEAAVIAETWFDHHRPQQPKKSRFDIYDIQHWAKTATKLVAEDIRTRIAPPPPPGEKP